MISAMTTSTPSSTPSGSEREVSWLIARACASEWPYRPDWLRSLRHPALSKRFERLYRMSVLPDLGERTVQVGLELIRRRARTELANREVKHFEVKIDQREGLRSIPHQRCNGQGCDGCRGLGVFFVADESSQVALMGWIAVVRRVA